MTTESRMASGVDRELRRLRRTVRGLALAVAAMPVLAVCVAMGSSRLGVVQAERFELVDDAGRVLAVLGTGEDGAGLTIVDDRGRQRLTISHGPEQTGLFILDDTETVRVGVAQFAHGGGGVALHGAESKGAGVLYYKDGGSLTFYGEGGEVLQRVAPEPKERP